MLLALAPALTTFAVVWLIQDWINALLNSLPITKGEFAGALDLVVTLAALPFILLVNILTIPGALAVTILEPDCGCGVATTAPVLIILAILCGLAGGGLWLHRRHD